MVLNTATAVRTGRSQHEAVKKLAVDEVGTWEGPIELIVVRRKPGGCATVNTGRIPAISTIQGRRGDLCGLCIRDYRALFVLSPPGRSWVVV